MAKIVNAKPKGSAGGYTRLLGQKELADIFTKAQSTVITNGTELEKIITKLSHKIDNLDDFIEQCSLSKIKNGVYLCPKKVIKKSKYKLDGNEPDFLIFIYMNGTKICDVLELKDGHVFDTKKSAKEREALLTFVNHIAPRIPFMTTYHICCFNENNKEKIFNGLKKVFSEDEILTGQELCNKLDIDYNLILDIRKKDASENFNYVIDEIIKIENAMDRIMKDVRVHIHENDFYNYEIEEP